jgi:EmrB/QacA subfamily drug resistance transporter
MFGMPAAATPVVFSHREILIILSGTLLGLFLGAIDQTIVATALPAIAGELHGMAHLSWTVSAYLLTATASTPIYGKLSDLYGRRALFRTAIAIFVVGSAWCALAHGMGELIAARALQGLGGGGLISLAQTIVADIIAPRERGRYQGYFAATWASATVGGPMLGGFFVDALSWRWVFWINLPVGLVALFLCSWALRRLPVHGVRRQIDYLGAALLTGAVVCLLLVTSWGGTELPWTSPAILGLCGGGLALTLLFLLQELRAPEPILPPRLFRDPVFRIANAVTVFMAMAAVGATVFLPLFLQVVIGVSASNSGLLIAPLMAGMTCGGFGAGQLMQRSGRYKIYPLVGLGLSTLAFLLLTQVEPATPAPVYGAFMLLLGVGLGSCGPTLLVSVQNAVPLGDLGTATSSIAFFRTMGGSFGVALLGAVLFAVLARDMAGAGAAGGAPAAVGALQGGFLHGGPAAIAALPEAARSAIVAGFGHTFRIVFVIGAGVTAAAWVFAGFLEERPLRSAARAAESAAPALRERDDPVSPG